jgi:hypothetical protein
VVGVGRRVESSGRMMEAKVQWRRQTTRKPGEWDAELNRENELDRAHAVWCTFLSSSSPLFLRSFR